MFKFIVVHTHLVIILKSYLTIQYYTHDDHYKYWNYCTYVCYTVYLMCL